MSYFRNSPSPDSVLKNTNLKEINKSLNLVVGNFNDSKAIEFGKEEEDNSIKNDSIPPAGNSEVYSTDLNESLTFTKTPKVNIATLAEPLNYKKFKKIKNVYHKIIDSNIDK